MNLPEKLRFPSTFMEKFFPESLRYWDWTIFYRTSAPCLLATTTTVKQLSYFFLVFFNLSIHSTTSWSINKHKKELDHEFHLAILTSHLVNNSYLLSCCIISGFLHFYSSRLEKWWCTVSILKKEAEVERIKKRRNFLHSSAAGFNRYVVNQSNKWNRCTRKEGNQETQQSYTQITE